MKRKEQRAKVLNPKHGFSQAKIAAAIAVTQAAYDQAYERYRKALRLGNQYEYRQAVKDAVKLSDKLERLQRVLAEGPRRRLPNPYDPLFGTPERKPRAKRVPVTVMVPAPTQENPGNPKHGEEMLKRADAMVRRGVSQRDKKLVDQGWKLSRKAMTRIAREQIKRNPAKENPSAESLRGWIREAERLQREGESPVAIASYLLERISGREAKIVMRVAGIKWPKSIVIENPLPVDEWDDEAIEEAMRLGSSQARALGQTERERRARPRQWKVTWYSPRQGKRASRLMPFVGYSAAEAIKEARAFINAGLSKGTPKAVNFVAKEIRENPGEWERNVKIIEKAIRKTIREARKQGTVGMSAGNLKQIISPLDLRGLTLRDKAAFDRAFDEALKRAGSGFVYNPGLIDLASSLQAAEYLSGKAKRGRNPAAFVASDSSRTCYRCGKRIKKGSVLVAGPDRLPYHQKCYRQAEKDAALALQKKNPSADAMSRRFQGQANGKVQKIFVSDAAPDLDFSRGGKLVFLKLAGGKQIKVPQAVVAIDPKTEKLWLGARRPGQMFNRKAAHAGEGLDFGALDAVCYETAKAHVGNGRAFEYLHTFGEGGGRKPHLIIDHEGMPILKGGDYRITAAGIEG